MTREEALQTLLDNAENGNVDIEEVKYVFTELLKKTPLSRREDDWIPVKWHAITEEERKREGYPNDWAVFLDCPLPNDNDEILITLAGRGSNYVEKDVCYVDDGWHLDSGYSWIDDVIAWMPLPEPYEAESEE